jgi:asparagine synthase (glutamine-hydrolysing)
MSMAHSLELRAPIVDREVMAFAARLPAEFKVKPGRLKIILRELCRRHYPDGFVDRPKYGFAFPMARWFAGEMAPFVQRVFDSGEVFEQGLLRRDRAQALFDEHRAGRADHNFKIWAIINLEVWHRLFVGGASREDCRAWLVECLGRQGARAKAGAGA